ncbi:MAG: alanine--tRNA ligase [Candidatus Sungbacteria bacterium]|uniref:alanine--tRNA ligase n=1 Tax=Candidatus Sungiibacteriota bacterium TaxID=2750080 RepID=A0A931SBU0_9BACT|nr:alanine--tRNA ligase [Candidatus Sungbacteria bacterium]
MESSEIRKRFLKFFEERGHTLIPSASLVPEGDVTTLFTGSGMQPLIKYLLGEKHPKGVRLVNSQKSFRAEDIDEVGDNRHTTFFEMLGNWSLGDYFKQEQLPWFFEFLTEEIGLDPNKLYVTVFAGDPENNVPRDMESVEIWKRLFKEKGIEAKDVELITEKNASELGMQGGRIFYYSTKNWWSRAGAPAQMPPHEPGGPDSEVFFEFTDARHDEKFGKYCHPNCDCGHFMEIGNSVFMEYIKKEDGTFENLAQQNVDFGGGLERITAASRNDPDMFNIDLLKPLISVLPTADTDQRRKCIIVDHARASFFLISDGVRPSNKHQGYILRRLLRRMIVQAHLGSFGSFAGTDTLSTGAAEDIKAVFRKISEVYQGIYPLNLNLANEVFTDEFNRFNRVFRDGLREIKRLEKIDAVTAFKLYESFGITYEIIKDVAGAKAETLTRNAFDKEFEKHQEISRAGIEKKFGGHGLVLDTGELKAGSKEELKIVTRLHTATHLLNAALHKVLGDSVEQRGSDITAERTRFDFLFPRKLTADEIRKIEDWVNYAIDKNFPVAFEEMPLDEAKRSGALFFYKGHYPERVKVYTVGNADEVFSRELCGGPHVAHTGEIGPFKIEKEESSSAGVRRIRAALSS